MENNRSNYNKEARTFYWYFRPIAFLAMCVGVFPLQNTYYRNGTKLRFKKISFPHLINASIFYTTAYLLYYYSGFVFVKKNYEIGFIWRCIALYLMTARSAICYIYCTTHAKKFTRLIKLLEIFDMKKTSLLNINEYNGIRRFMIWTVCPIFYLFAILSVSFYELNKVAEGIFNNTMDNCEDVFVASKVFGTLGTWQTAPLFLYMYFTIIIKYNLLEIIKILKSNNIVSNFQMKDSKNDIYSISNTRHMYTIVTSSVKKVSDIFGTFLAIDQFCLIAMFVVNIYVFFFTNNRDIHLLIYTFLNALIIAIVINVSNKIKDLVREIKYRRICLVLNATLYFRVKQYWIY